MNPPIQASWPMKEQYLSPDCNILNLILETPVLQFSTKNWERDPNEL